MDQQSAKILAGLLRGRRVAALGTLRRGAPLVSLVQFAPAADLSWFLLHISALAFHTQDIKVDPRVSLMVAEADDGSRNPLTLARVSIQGAAEAVPPDSPDYEACKALYLARFPEAEINFSLGDFSLYRIVPSGARFVAGFGSIFNLTPKDFLAAAGSAD